MTPGYTFSPHYKSDSISVLEGGVTAHSKSQWGTVLLAQGRCGLESTLVHGNNNTRATIPPHPPISQRFTCAFTVKDLEPTAGCAVGVVDPDRFDAREHVFGIHPGNWCYSSKTGKIYDGGVVPGVWREYGEPYTEGDVITMEVFLSEDDVTKAEESYLKFYKNGIFQGTAFRGPELRRVAMDGGGGSGTQEYRPVNLVPGVCLGSASGGKTVRVTAGHAEVREFDKTKAHHRILFSDENTTVANSGKWATALAAHPGIRTGKFSWSIHLDETRSGAGVAIGVVDASTFQVDRQNLGASTSSWCYSKTGKRGDGSGFHAYGKTYTMGDTVTLTLDFDAATLSFAINGEDQGVAYRAEDGIGKCALIPAVCLGSSECSKMAKVSVVGARPLLRRFDRFACSSKVSLKALYQSVETNDKWGTVLLEHAGIKTPSRYSFAVTVESAEASCGAGVGFADSELFDPEKRNLGAHDGSWCYSKTGKFSKGKDFLPYGAPFKSGDVITAEVDMELEIMRFYVNGRLQSDIRLDNIKSRTLIPAVVLGSNAGGNYTKLSIGLPSVSRFDRRRLHKSMELVDDDRTSRTGQRWCSALVDHPGVTQGGILRFAVKLDGEGGAAIGFAEASNFRPYAQNLGASPSTWAISKTGKVSQGDEEGFRPFSDKFSSGNIIGAEADLVEGIIRFWKDGVLLGTAFQNLLEVGTGPGRRSQITLVPAVCLGSNQGGKNSSAQLVEFDYKWLN